MDGGPPDLRLAQRQQRVRADEPSEMDGGGPSCGSLRAQRLHGRVVQPRHARPQSEEPPARHLSDPVFNLVDRVRPHRRNTSGHASLHGPPVRCGLVQCRAHRVPRLQHRGGDLVSRGQRLPRLVAARFETQSRGHRAQDRDGLQPRVHRAGRLQRGQRPFRRGFEGTFQHLCFPCQRFSVRGYGKYSYLSRQSRPLAFCPER